MWFTEYNKREVRRVQTMDDNKMTLDSYQFSVDEGSFRYITDSISGAGWDFNFSGECLNDTEDELFPFGFRLLCEAAPLPFEKSSDYTGKEIYLEKSYDEESGEPYFGINVWEEHELSKLTLKILKKDGKKYLIEITAMAAETILGEPSKVHLLGWAMEEADHAYPV